MSDFEFKLNKEIIYKFSLITPNGYVFVRNENFEETVKKVFGENANVSLSLGGKVLRFEETVDISGVDNLEFWWKKLIPILKEDN